jgi:hypothetical protein
MSKRDGGPAFPGAVLPEHPNHPVGMSKREYFAGQIMAALCASGPHDCTAHELGLDAVSFADALLQALAQGEQ